MEKTKYNKKETKLDHWKLPTTRNSFYKSYEILIEKKRTSKESDIDPVDVFLKGIGATLKKFDPYFLNLAKSRIFNTVQDIEMSNILNKQQSCAPNNQPSSSVSSNSLYSNYSQSQSSQIIQPDNTIFTPSAFTTFGNENQHQ